MSRNIRVRLERLERLHPVRDTESLPRQFWKVLCGAVSPEELDPKTRQLMESLFEDGRDAPDPIEEYLAAVEAGQVREGDTFESFLARTRASVSSAA